MVPSWRAPLVKWRPRPQVQLVLINSKTSDLISFRCSSFERTDNALDGTGSVAFRLSFVCHDSSLRYALQA